MENNEVEVCFMWRNILMFIIKHLQLYIVQTRYDGETWLYRLIIILHAITLQITTIHKVNS